MTKKDLAMLIEQELLREYADGTSLHIAIDRGCPGSNKLRKWDLDKIAAHLAGKIWPFWPSVTLAQAARPAKPATLVPAKPKPRKPAKPRRRPLGSVP